jgi:hypothetical protein
MSIPAQLLIKQDTEEFMRGHRGDDSLAEAQRGSTDVF